MHPCDKMVSDHSLAFRGGRVQWSDIRIFLSAERFGHALPRLELESGRPYGKSSLLSLPLYLRSTVQRVAQCLLCDRVRVWCA